MDQHTAASWTVDERPGQSLIVARGPIISGVVAVINTRWPNPVQCAQQKANARLIAAAPDLLDALFALLQYPSGQYSEGGDFDAAWDKAEKLAKQFGLEVD